MLCCVWDLGYVWKTGDPPVGGKSEGQFSAWCLEFVCNLVLEIWNLEASASEICPLPTTSVVAEGLHREEICQLLIQNT